MGGWVGRWVAATRWVGGWAGGWVGWAAGGWFGWLVGWVQLAGGRRLVFYNLVRWYNICRPSMYWFICRFISRLLVYYYYWLISIITGLLLCVTIVVEILAPPLPGTLLATWSTLVIEDLL